MENNPEITSGGVKESLTETAETILSTRESCSDDIAAAARLLAAAVKEGYKVLWCGNGGSAAQAQHLSTELVGGLRNHHRPPITSVSLTTDTSLLTAWTNDISFDTVFSRQVEALGKKGDVLVAISTSGNSPNILKAAEMAGKKGLKTIVLTGEEGGELKDLGDSVVSIPSSDTQRIQEGHIAAGHIICELVERAVVSPVE